MFWTITVKTRNNLGYERNDYELLYVIPEHRVDAALV
jgi:hypothetical protein